MITTKNSIKTKFNDINEKSLYFIVDIGANHNGSLEKAIDLIHLAKESGANAAKFQNFAASTIVSQHEFDKMPSMTHQAQWKKSVYEVYDDASISLDWTEKLKDACDDVGIDYFTSPYDLQAVDHVSNYVEIFKIGSGDITWLEVIEYIIDKEKPIILATGASDLDDVVRAMGLINKKKAPHVLMQCNTNYTGSINNFNFINLNVLTKYSEIFPESILGLSDHTPGHATVLGSIALGARVIEKHFTDDQDQDGPDHKFAMTPTDWREMVDRSNELLSSLGDGNKKIEKNEEQSFSVQRRSVCCIRDVKSGHVIKESDLCYLRPFLNDSFHPYQKDELIGKTIIRDLVQGQSIKKDFIC
tara:strand:- start:1661 stop:2734 length:1074 start_codon:yes stop_codon:yes gene_type:complete